MADKQFRHLGADCIDPVLFHAMFACMIGEDCPFPTVKAAADHFGVPFEQFRLFVRGKRPPEPKVLRALGFEKVILYRPLNANPHNAKEIEHGSNQ